MLLENWRAKMKKAILLTGSSGFLGSALCVDLSKSFRVIAVDRRAPTALLKSKARGVLWETADIADSEFTRRLKRDIFPQIGRIDAIVHFAAYYDFEKKWGPEYEWRENRRTNDPGC
jgi:nucleoside-diphosphate-sugar epimerase